MKRVYWKAEATHLDDPNYLDSMSREVTTEENANLISSLADDEYNGMRINYDKRHFPVLDLDFPCELIPSSTPGKFHLYMNKEVTWLQYQNVLTAMAQAGLLEPGYVGASIAQGATFVRKPGVFKKPVSPFSLIKTSTFIFPEPSCELGYTSTDLAKFLGPTKFKEFSKWMTGQTISGCAEHGMITYRDDLVRFMNGLPIID